MLLADAIAQDRRLIVVADYDCDGATACAVAVRGLRLLGTRQVDYLVPDRVADGYGLTPSIARRVHERGADMLITVDNGIASVDGVAEAKALGLQVLVTDHHLPGPALPLADAMVNPNQPGCSFESKSIAGVGVMFYVLMALRAELRERGVFDKASQPKLEPLLPLVALGTVADVVRLDSNNRRLVAQGLRRIRAGAMPAGIAALFDAAGRKAPVATTFDFGFALGPRINAAGRLADMTLGIECLLTDDPGRAAELARTLDAINRERREIEGGMREQALLMAESLFEEGTEPPPAISVFDPDFHEGVVGIVASRIKDKLHRPTFVFAASAAPGKGTNSRARGGPFRAFTCATRSTSWPSATRARCSSSAAMPWRPAARWPRNTSPPSSAPSPWWRRSGWTPPRSPAGSTPTGPWPRILPRGHGGHPAPRGLGPGLRAAHVQRGGRGAVAAPGGREQAPPVAQAAAPGPAGGRHLVRPHRAAALARAAGVPAGRERVEGRAAGAVSGGRRAALRGRRAIVRPGGPGRCRGPFMGKQASRRRIDCLICHQFHSKQPLPR